MKKTLISFAAVALMGLTAQAQSTDATYPMGIWQTPDSEETETSQADDFFVSLDISRENKPIDRMGGRVGCGYFSITDNKTNKDVYEATLTYMGKDLKDGVSTGTYFFTATTKAGKTCTLCVNAGKMPMIVAIGELKGHPALKQELQMVFSNSGGVETYGLYCDTEKELLDDLRLAAKDRRAKTPGFGNLQQYINAHAKLDPSKPKFAKPKGASAINVRQNPNATAPKIAELKPGETLFVYDEFDGWCKLTLGDGKFGWVSLSVVTLTNTEGKKPAIGTASQTAKQNTTPATPAAAPAETTCPLVGNWYGTLGNGDGSGWGETTVFLQAGKKVGVNPKMAKRQSNGAIDMTDEAYVREWNYNLVFNRTVSDNVYEFTVQRQVGKQLKSGKVQIRCNGDNITMTGLDAWTRQQPFHGKTIGKP